MLTGSSALVGWIESSTLLKNVSPQFVSLKANEALALVLLGAALWIASSSPGRLLHWLRAALEVAAFALGAATLFAYATKVGFGIDQMLFRAPLGEFQTVAPGRMSVVAAASIVLAAAALLAAHRNSRRNRVVSRTLATCVALAGLVTLLGYLYGAPQLYRPSAATSAMAVHAAAAFIVLGGGIAALRPEYGLPSIAVGQTLTGTHIRWLFPAAVIVPLLIGGAAVQIYETFGVARAAIALTAAGTSVAIGFAIALVALWLRRMEDTLELTHGALAATRQGVLIADGSRPGVPVIYVNDAFTRLTQYAARDALGRPYDFFAAAAADREALAALESGTADEDAVTLSCKRRDGSVFSGRISLSAVAGRDGARNVVGVLEDVTEEQIAAAAKLELLAEASQARKEAEEANRVKDVFFASITHELRSPLNACLMWLDVLSLGPQSEKQAKGVDAIKRNLAIQTRLVNDLIDAAKISSGGIEIHREPLEIETLIEGNLDTWRLLGESRGVTFSHHLPEERHILAVDPERLLQVLNNLLENAFRNTPKDGHVELRLIVEHDAIAIEVTDTGRGLSATDLKQVFTPFWRVESPKRDHKGLGLGLSIAEHVVKGHHGTIEAHSEGLDKGCVFTVRLPYSPARPQPATRARRART